MEAFNNMNQLWFARSFNVARNIFGVPPILHRIDRAGMLTTTSSANHHTAASAITTTE
jgi:hypothetical protein